MCCLALHGMLGAFQTNTCSVSETPPSYRARGQIMAATLARDEAQVGESLALSWIMTPAAFRPGTAAEAALSTQDAKAIIIHLPCCSDTSMLQRLSTQQN